MTQEQETLLLIKGSISELSAEHQQAIKDCVADVRNRLAAAGAVAGYVVALLGAELAAME